MQRERDTAYGLTLVWALVAVYGQQQSRAVRIAALVCLAANMLLAIISLLRWAFCHLFSVYVARLIWGIGVGPCSLTPSVHLLRHDTSGAFCVRLQCNRQLLCTGIF